MKNHRPAIPPLLLVLIFSLLMWLVASASSGITLPLTLRYAGCLVFFVVGTLSALAGVTAFRRAQTTVNPRRPEATASLVSTGIYRWSRNPMYVGFAAWLIAWAFFLANPYALALVAGFVAYINRFQIKPEEQVLAEIFGDEFIAYKKRVRRWL